MKYIINDHGKIVDALELTEVFIHTVNSHTVGRRAPKGKSNAEVYTDFCINHIENNLHRRIAVKELTELIGVSQPYLFTIFQERFKLSPKQYIMYAKQQQAKKLLRETDLSIKEIANSIGYDDMFLFSKCFKLHEGMPPSKYRALFTKNQSSQSH